KLRKLLLVSIVIFSVYNCYSQSAFEYYKVGKNAFNNSDYEEAIGNFNHAMEFEKIQKSDVQFASLLYWKSLATYLINSKDESIKINLENAIKKDDNAKNIILYIQLFPENIENILKDFEYKRNNYSDKHYFYIKALRACYDNTGKYSKDEIFGNLESSLFKGYNDSIVLFANSPFIDINENRFLNLLSKYNISNSMYSNSIAIEIKKFVESKINNWQKKGKFEKTTDYRKRVNEKTRNEKVNLFTKNAIDQIAKEKINCKDVKNEYDPDNEVFKLIFNDIKSIYIKVPIDEAKSFDANFKKLNYKNIQFALVEDNFEISHLKVVNPEISKSYIYDNNNIVAFSKTQLALSFDKIDINIPKQENSGYVSNESVNIIKVGKSDVDLNIPITKKMNTNIYALIIGNEDYTKYQTDLNSESNVDFANSDAIVFSKYLEQTIGIPRDNIVLLTDAIGSEMKREIEKLSKLAKYSNGKAELIFYYAGHGFPDEKTKESYIMPVDIGGANVRDGIKLIDLYNKLTEFPTQKVSVFIDACFSGGARNQGLLAARSVKIKPKKNQIKGNIVIFSASSGEQSSLPYKEKQHGMFTYYLLKNLQKTKGNISYKELAKNIIDDVQFNAIKINGKDQNPKVLYSPTIVSEWGNWKLK
ncbi:MAG: caspase family protein, partial [Bacteroidota bacterium]|nr:caspase family protein [Bacteroidota bacterium]